MPAAGNAAGRSRRATKRAAGNGEAHQSKIQDFFQQNKMPRTAGAAGGGPRRAGKDEEEDVPGVATDKNLFEDDEDAAHVQASLSQSPTQPDVAGEEVPKEEEEEAHMQESLSQTPTQPDVAGEEELKEEEEEDGARGRTFQFRDAVHGDMTTTLAANAWIKELCETGPFQRLLETKQLGACFHVFERAVHTRAEHSVGVCYLASRMLDSLTNSIKDLHTACEGSVPHGCPVILYLYFFLGASVTCGCPVCILKVLSLVILYSLYTRALTLDNLVDRTLTLKKKIIRNIEQNLFDRR
jgi:hypothetical protein